MFKLFKNKNKEPDNTITYEKINTIIKRISKLRNCIDEDIKQNRNNNTYGKGYNIALSRVDENLEALINECIKIKYNK